MDRDGVVCLRSGLAVFQGGFAVAEIQGSCVVSPRNLESVVVDVSTDSGEFRVRSGEKARAVANGVLERVSQMADVHDAAHGGLPVSRVAIHFHQLEPIHGHHHDCYHGRLHVFSGLLSASGYNGGEGRRDQCDGGMVYKSVHGGQVLVDFDGVDVLVASLLFVFVESR